MWASAQECRWGQQKALRERDSFSTENRLEMGGECGPISVNSELHTQPDRECLQGCVVQLSEARGCVDEG